MKSIKSMLGRLLSKRNDRYGWSGDYSSWEKARAVSGGYDQQVILERTAGAMLKVKNNEAVYERDSVLFDKKEYPHALIAFLIYSATIRRAPLHILDFGGSLGTTYYQIREFLTAENCASWNIVEQEHYVHTGNRDFSDERLKFYSSIDDCMKDRAIDFVLLSSTVQYLEAPHVFLKELAERAFDFILFDRTTFNTDRQDRITLQRVPPEIYPASYPSWFFHEDFFLSHFSGRYKVVAEFPSYVDGESEMCIDGKQKGICKGFFLINSQKYA